MPHGGQDNAGCKRDLARDVSIVSLEDGLEALVVTAIKEDEASKLEGFLKKESAKLAAGEAKRSAYDALVAKIFHLSCACNSSGCCDLLLTAIDSFPVVRINAMGRGGRSGLHYACRHHSTKAIEVLLSNGASVSLKNKEEMLLPLEEALLSFKLDLADDLVATPAAELVEAVRIKDLSAIQMLVPLCKEQLSSIACKLLRDLRVVPLVALLLTAGQIANAVPRSELEVPGTVVDLLLSYVLPPTPFAPVDVDGTGYKIKVVGNGAAKAGVKTASSNPTKTTSTIAAASCKSEVKATALRKIQQKVPKLLPAQGPAAMRSFSSLYKRQDGKDSIPLATKLLECILLFYPRLTAHPQSSFTAPLIRACQGNDFRLVSLLLNSGAPVNEQDGDGNTPLHWVLRQATPSNDRRVNLDIVEKLLEAGANTILGNRLGATPVHTAAGHGHSEALFLMLTKDLAGVNVMAATKETPLHYATINNHIHCAAILLKFGANRNVCNLRNMKPCNLAPTREMYALLSVDEKTLKLHPWESLVALFSRPDTRPVFHPRQAGTYIPSARKDHTNSRKVFVGGLPLYATSEDLRDEMEYEFGEVTEAAVISCVESSGKRRSRGFGFVTFKHEETAMKAVRSRFFSIRGKMVEVKGTDYSEAASLVLEEPAPVPSHPIPQPALDQIVSAAPKQPEVRGVLTMPEDTTVADASTLPGPGTALHWTASPGLLHTPVQGYTPAANGTAGMASSTAADSEPLDLEHLLSAILSTEDAPVPGKKTATEDTELAEILSLLQVGKGGGSSSSRSLCYGLDGPLQPAFRVW